MNTPPEVILISNDVVPGCGMPVAAPGLRVYGLGAGLRAHGYPVTTVVMRGPLLRQWRGSLPPPLARDTVALPAERLDDYLVTRSPAVVVLTNANQVDRLPEVDDNRYIIDFFAPKLLELIYEGGADGAYPVEELRLLRERKLRGIERADGFIVNGRKKLPYFLAWILQTDRDLRTLPFEHVGMCLPSSFDSETTAGRVGPVRLAMAGYLQGWSVPGTWLRVLSDHLGAEHCTLDAMMPEHWGGASGFENPEVAQLMDTQNVRVHHAQPFSEYQQFLARSDVVLDLFERTLERELAVVTRTIAALSCGKPVVHPPFTEVAPLIEECDAGWLVDPAEEDALALVLEEILADPQTIDRKAEGARTLWARHLDPAVAVDGLIRVIERIAGVMAST